jgi:hypothetical protein
MRRGRELEPVARERYNKTWKLNCQPCVALSDENPWQMASLDGWDPDQQMLLEIKCPGESVFRDAQAGQFSAEYIWQCLHQLAVCPEARGNCLYFYFEGPNGPESTELVIDRSESDIVALTGLESVFYHNFVLQFVEPPLGPLDYQQRDDALWEELCFRYKIIKKEIEGWEAEEKIVREHLIGLADNQSCRGAGIQLTKYTRQGNVEYAKIPELRGVDLSAYRKPPIDAWRLSKVETNQTD